MKKGAALPPIFAFGAASGLGHTVQGYPLGCAGSSTQAGYQAGED